MSTSTSLDDDYVAPSDTRLQRVSQRLSDDAELTRTAIFGGLALGLAVLAVLVSYAVRPATPAEFDDVGEPFFPEFTDASEAGGIRVAAWDETQSRTESFEVKKEGSTWVIPTHSDYPVDGEEQLAAAATSVLGITRDVRKAATEADFERFDLIDPLNDSYTGDKGRGKRVTLTDENGDTLADYIVGKQIAAGTGEGEDAVPATYYVRRADEDRVYQARFDLDISTRFPDWIESDLLTIDRGQITDLTIRRYNDDDTVEISEVKRETPDDDWTLARLTEEEGSLQVSAVNDLLQELDELSLIGVRRKPEGVAALLKGTGRSLGLVDQLDLQDKGFGISQQGGLESFGGQLLVDQQDGLLVQLLFGDSFTGSQLDIEVGGQEKTDETTDESETIRGRYVFVVTGVDESLLPPLPEKPTEPADDAEDAEKTAYQSALQQYEQAVADRARTLAATTEKEAELNKRFADWYYVISDESYATLLPSRGELVDEPETDAPADAMGTDPAAGGAGASFNLDDLPFDLPGGAGESMPALPAVEESPAPPSEGGEAKDAADSPETALSDEERSHLLEAAKSIGEQSGE